MPNPTANSTTQPTPAPTRTPRGTINKNYTDGLDKAKDVCDAAQNPLYNAQIIDGVEITAAFLTGLQTEIASARAYLGAAVGGRGTKKTSTAQESAAKIALAQALQGIQTRAYQKFHVSQPNRVRDTYAGGTNLFDAADPMLEQIATNFLGSAPGDALPKVDAARIANLQTLFDAWNAARGVQSTSAGQSLTTFDQFKTAFEAVEAKRRSIQFAADDDFPYYESANKAAREAFKLPAKSPFRV